VGTTLQPSDPPRIGPYRLVSVLGEGGMGRVYLGRSAGGQLVAVKMIRRELADNPQFRARFRREVAAARRVNGLYTAHVVDADTGAPEPWLATAYINAPSLAAKVGEDGRLSHDAVRLLAAALAEGLSKIHAVGLVHRDLKPANVLLASDGPRIIDFGIARSAESDALTRSDSIVGTPSYMSPEQARGDKVGPPSDVFSLGAVIYFAATGAGLWGHGTTEAMLYRVVHEPPKLMPLPTDISSIVTQCLAKRPEKRPTPGEILALIGDSDMIGGGGAAPPRTAQDLPVRPMSSPGSSTGPRLATGRSTESLPPIRPRPSGRRHVPPKDRDPVDTRDIQGIPKWPEPAQANALAPPSRVARDIKGYDGDGLKIALLVTFAAVVIAIAVLVWFINPWFAVSVYGLTVLLIIYGAIRLYFD
jgi:serine/threonine protein kinase